MVRVVEKSIETTARGETRGTRRARDLASGVETRTSGGEFRRDEPSGDLRSRGRTRADVSGEQGEGGTSREGAGTGGWEQSGEFPTRTCDARAFVATVGFAPLRSPPTVGATRIAFTATEETAGAMVELREAL